VTYLSVISIVDNANIIFRSSHRLMPTFSVTLLSERQLDTGFPGACRGDPQVRLFRHFALFSAVSHAHRPRLQGCPHRRNPPLRDRPRHLKVLPSRVQFLCTHPPGPCRQPTVGHWRDLRFTPSVLGRTGELMQRLLMARLRACKLLELTL